MTKITLDKATRAPVYTFDFTDKVKLGSLSQEETYEVFRDGRFAAHFLERELTKHFHLSFVNKTGYDHVDPTGQKYDAKNFTKRGLSFMPSNQLGEGRKFNADVAHAKAKELIYICCDIVDFPKVRVKFAYGADLVKEYPKCKVPKGYREALFG